MLNLIKTLLPGWVIPAVLAVAALGVIALLAWQNARIDTLKVERESLRRDIDRYKADIDFMVSARASEDAVQANEVEDSRTREKRKVELHEQINAASDDAPVSPVLRDALVGLRGTNAAAKGR